jgi:hypothetical protein
MLQVAETDKAYLAGLIDGEGCIHIAETLNHRTPNRPPVTEMHLIVAITSVDRDFLDYYQKLTGLGSVHNGSKDHDNCRATFQWWITSKQATAMLFLVYPYLKIKKEQADIAFKFQETMNKSFGGKGEGCIKGGKRVNPDILLQRQRYKQALTRTKGYKTKRGRPKQDEPHATP